MCAAATLPYWPLAYVLNIKWAVLYIKWAANNVQGIMGPVDETEALVARWLAIFGRAQQYEAVMRNALKR